MDHDIFVGRLKNLGKIVEMLYQRTGKIEDLEEAIGISRQVVQLIPKHEPDLAERLDNLGGMVEKRHKCIGNMGDLDEAIRISQQAVELTPKDHPSFETRFNHLNVKLQLRGQSTLNKAAMEAGRSRAEITKATSPTSQSVESTSVANLAQQLGSLDLGTAPAPSLPKIGSDSKIPTPNRLCRLCQTVFEGDYSPPKSWIRHHHENNLEHSASDGFHMCILILYALQKKVNPSFQDDIARMAPKAGFGRQIG